MQDTNGAPPLSAFPLPAPVACWRSGAYTWPGAIRSLPPYDVGVLPSPTVHGIPGLPPDPPSAPESAERLARLAKRVPDLDALLAQVERAPDPDLALAGVERFLDGAGELPPERDLLEALLLLCGSSRMAARRCWRATRACSAGPPARPGSAAPAPRPPCARLLARAAAAARPGRRRRLPPAAPRGSAAREVVRIALRDLRRARVREVTGELSALATACLDAAIRFHDRRLRARHGAAGGARGARARRRLLRPRHGQAGRARAQLLLRHRPHLRLRRATARPPGERPLTHFAYFAKLAELVTEALAKPTEDGFVFRVDLNLRPDGRSGPIVNSVRAAELYYQSFGRTWERNALRQGPARRRRPGGRRRAAAAARALRLAPQPRPRRASRRSRP